MNAAGFVCPLPLLLRLGWRLLLCHAEGERKNYKCRSNFPLSEKVNSYLFWSGLPPPLRTCNSYCTRSACSMQNGWIMDMEAYFKAQFAKPSGRGSGSGPLLHPYPPSSWPFWLAIHARRVGYSSLLSDIFTAINFPDRAHNLTFIIIIIVGLTELDSWVREQGGREVGSEAPPDKAFDVFGRCAKAEIRTRQGELGEGWKEQMSAPLHPFLPPSLRWSVCPSAGVGFASPRLAAVLT